MQVGGVFRDSKTFVDAVPQGDTESDAIVADGSVAPEIEDTVAQYVPTARPGHRAPHLWLDDDKTVSTLDSFGASMTALTGSPETATPFASGAYAAVPFSVHVLEPERWHAFAGVSPDGAVLVRPDGYVGWRCPSAATAAGLADALRRITSA